MPRAIPYRARGRTVPDLRRRAIASALADQSLHRLARAWWQQFRGARPIGYLVAETRAELLKSLQHLPALLAGPGQGQGGLYFSRSPLGLQGGVAFVYPGSGNHYAGMGRQLALLHPAVVERLDTESEQLRSYMAADWTMPYRQSWEPGWEGQSTQAIAADLHRSIFGQVMFGLLMSDILAHYGLKPQHAIGYSLGESASLMSLRAWSQRQEIYQRMQSSDLFRQQLGGPCLAARRYWQVPEGQPFEWKVAVLNRPARQVRPLIRGRLALLIVNTDQECVVGGDAPEVAALIERNLGACQVLEETLGKLAESADAETVEVYERATREFLESSDQLAELSASPVPVCPRCGSRGEENLCTPCDLDRLVPDPDVHDMEYNRAMVGEEFLAVYQAYAGVVEGEANLEPLLQALQGLELSLLEAQALAEQAAEDSPPHQELLNIINVAIDGVNRMHAVQENRLTRELHQGWTQIFGAALVVHQLLELAQQGSVVEEEYQEYEEQDEQED